MKAMDENVIREFLIGLGVKVDENEIRKFVSNIEGITGRVLQLGTAVVGMAAVAVTATHKIAEGFEKLNYNAQLSGDSIKNIKALEFGVKQFGGTIEQVGSEFASFAEKFQSNPAFKGFLQSLGVNTDQENTKVFADYVKRLNEMPENWRRLAYANGAAVQISRETLQAFQNGAETQIAVYKRMADRFGVDFEKMGRDSAKFERGYRTAVEGIAFGWRYLEGLLVSGANDIIEAFDPVQNLFDEINRSFGLSGGFASVVKTAGYELTQLERIAHGLLTGVFKPLADIVLLITHLLSGQWKAAWGDTKNILSDLANAVNEIVVAVASLFSSQLGQWAAKKLGVAAGPDRYASNGITATSGATTGPSDSAGKAFQMLKGLGLSAAQAAGVVANLMTESNLNPDALGDNGQAYGIQQLHPDRQARFAQLMGKPVQGSSLEEQITFLVREMKEGMESTAWNVLRQSQSPEEAGRAFSMFNERPRDAYGEAMRRGALATSLFNKFVPSTPGIGGNFQFTLNSNVNVNGSGDPRTTANLVNQGQSRVWGDATRNFTSAVGRRGSQ